MSWTELCFLAIALAMDCFTVSLSCGIIQRRMGRQVWAMAFLFGLFQALMPLLGWLMINAMGTCIQDFDHWIAFSLLTLLGGKMVFSSLRGCEGTVIQPSSLFALFMLAVATSIDAMAIGLSFPAMGVKQWHDLVWPLTVIGLVSFLLSIVGKYLGVVIGRRICLPAEPVGGLILIIIGVKVFITHLAG